MPVFHANSVSSFKLIPMPRIHLFEFEDLSWFPSRIRNYMTDYLQFVANKYDMYEAIVPVLEKGLAQSLEKRIIDLASGGGGGWKSLSVHVKEKLPKTSVTLTDYYPNVGALQQLVDTDPEFFSFEQHSVSALEVPESMKGLRTQFLSFHHFKPEDSKQILQNAVDAGQPIAIFEAQRNSVVDVLKLALSPINVLAFTPMIKPVTFGRIFFTYLLPLVPLFTWWDGIVSVLRSYSEKEQRTLIAQLQNGDNYKWEIDQVRSGMFTIYYLLGYKKP